MDNNEIFLSKLYREKMLDTEEITKPEYDRLKNSSDMGAFQLTGTCLYYKTTGITDKTKTEIQFRTYKCIKTIKNILLATFIISTVSISLYILLLLSAK